MPHLSAWAIRLALLHLAAGFTIGLLILANKGVPFAPAIWRLLPAHIELLLVGWTVQLAMAVVHWIVPRFRGGDFGRLWLAQLSFGLLNSGVIVVSLGPFVGISSSAAFLGRLLEACAVLSFALYIWPRIRPQGS